ncbi:MAG: 50S ribosomal protein L4 [Ignavibacteria bacterium]|nr:50S ribosomal protein L4 [Ignavibacteria bacterium]MBI3765172.1 50S ribosomal protein L4 [Ignavibacteriales bacterium]
MELEVYKKDGSISGDKIKLAPEIFEIEPNDHAIYQAVRAYLANQRQGTHKTKTYGEVSGSGKKLWKQKHTGRARIGAVRSPLWKGGGTIFGPTPRDYSMNVPKQVKQLARKSALSHKAKDAAIKIVEDFSLDQPKTKSMADILKALELSGKKTLLLVPKADQAVWKSGRNIRAFAVLEASKASAYQLLDNQMLLIQKSAIEVLEKTFH